MIQMQERKFRVVGKGFGLKVDVSGNTQLLL